MDNPQSHRTDEQVLREQRDELLEALEKAVLFIGMMHVAQDIEPETSPEYCRLRALLTKYWSQPAPPDPRNGD